MMWFRLLWRTVRADRRRFQMSVEGISARRVWGVFRPNLQNPVFIVGAPRSGTTFLGNCIATLPEFSYHFEPVITKYASQYIYEQKWSPAKAQRIYRFAYGLLMRLHGTGHLRFAEKTPRNCFLIPFLSEAFPTAQFIHIVRDGRDAALSYSQKPWLQASAGGSGKVEPGGFALGPTPRFWVEADRRQAFAETSDIHRCIWAWRRHVEAARRDLAALDAGRVCEVRYETLLRQPHLVAEGLLSFLGIENTASRERFLAQIGMVDENRIGRYQTQLDTDQLAQIKAEAGSLLRELNYT